MNKSLSQNELKEIIDYEPETGIFRWKYRKTLPVKAGTIAGSSSTKGYLRIKINDTTYLAHRLAWLYVYGIWPIGDIDHINRDQKDNRISNLRDVNRTVNNLNRGNLPTNSTGYRCVFFNKQRGNFIARLMLDKKAVHLGSFKTPEEASKVVQKALLDMGVVKS